MAGVQWPVASADGGAGLGTDSLLVSGNWQLATGNFVQAPRATRCAFVSTNSITQGEQVGILWPWLLAHGIHIRFAHRSFQWSNEARANATVHCVIIGFGLGDCPDKRIFSYVDAQGTPQESTVANISPYLTDGPSTVVTKRRQPLDSVPAMRCGNMPNDGGHLLLTDAERADLLSAEPAAAPFIKRFVGAEEFINNHSRWCLWLPDVSPSKLRSMPRVLARVEHVRAFRMASTAEPTRRAAQTPARFFFVSHPPGDYLLVPEVSSHRRQYIPIGFMPSGVISSNTNFIIGTPSLYLFGMLHSQMHMAWTRLVGGRLGNGYRYSPALVYNTFPWPKEGHENRRTRIESAAQSVLHARSQFPNECLASLYDPASVPPLLVSAHRKLDAAVDEAYSYAAGPSDAARVAFLLRLYSNLTSILPPEESPRGRKKR